MVQEGAKVSELMVVVRAGMTDLLVDGLPRCSRRRTCARQRDTAGHDRRSAHQSGPGEQSVYPAFSLHGNIPFSCPHLRPANDFVGRKWGLTILVAVETVILQKLHRFAEGDVFRSCLGYGAIDGLTT